MAVRFFTVTLLPNGDEKGAIALRCGGIVLWRLVIFVTFSPRKFRTFQIIWTRDVE